MDLPSFVQLSATVGQNVHFQSKVSEHIHIFRLKYNVYLYTETELWNTFKRCFEIKFKEMKNGVTLSTTGRKDCLESSTQNFP